MKLPPRLPRRPPRPRPALPRARGQARVGAALHPGGGPGTIADFWRFDRRWHPLLGGTPQQKELDAMRVEFIRPLETATEVTFLAMLNEAVATHRRHLVVEGRVGAGAASGGSGAAREVQRGT